MKAAPTKESVARIQILNDDDVRGDEWERLDRLAAYAGTCRHIQAPASFVSQTMTKAYTEDDTEGNAYLSVRVPGWSSGLRVSMQAYVSQSVVDGYAKYRIGTSVPLSSDYHELYPGEVVSPSGDEYEIAGWVQSIPGIIGAEDTYSPTDLPITWEDTPGEYIVQFSLSNYNEVLAINISSTIQDHADLTTAA